MFNVGDRVNYHSRIGGAVTSTGHTIKAIEQEPNNFGCDVAWIAGKSGCVALAALSNKQHPAQKPLTESQKRYQAYLSSETTETFIEWLQASY